MKRDARIGLAVVLVLGLGVTLLIGKAIYKRGAVDTEGEFADAGLGDGGNNFMNATGNRPSVPDLGLNLPQQPIAEILPPGDQYVPPRAPVPGDPPGDSRDHLDETPKLYAYTTVNGDNPWEISKKIFGEGKYTQKIVDANHLLPGKKIKPGMTLKIPAVAKLQLNLPPYDAKHEVAPAPALIVTPVTPTAPAGKRYKVESGDSLARIAKKYYGNDGPKTIQMIVAANHGMNPTKLKVGQEITLPASK